jgi:hypothetical protein
MFPDVGSQAFPELARGKVLPESIGGKPPYGVCAEVSTLFYGAGDYGANVGRVKGDVATTFAEGVKYNGVLAEVGHFNSKF